MQLNGRMESANDFATDMDKNMLKSLDVINPYRWPLIVIGWAANGHE